MIVAPAVAPRNSRTRRAGLNLAGGLLLTTVTLASGLLATPWILRHLGSEAYGTFRVLSDLFSNLGLLEFGLGGSLLASFARLIGTGARSEIPGLLSAGIHAYLRLTLCMAIVGLALVALLPRLLAPAGVSARTLQWTGLLLLIPVLLLPFSTGKAFAEARQLGYVVTFFITGQSLLITGLMAIAAGLGWGLPGQALATALGQVIVLPLLMWWSVRGFLPRWTPRSDPAARKAVWALSRPAFVTAVSGRLGLLSDNIVLALVFSPAAVAPFFLTQRLATMTLTQLQGIGNATWAGLAELHFQGESTAFRSHLLELTALTSGLSVASLGAIAAYNAHFVSRWVGVANYAGDPINILACVNLWLWSLTSLWAWPLSGTGQVVRWLPFAVAFMVVNLTISIWGTLHFGMQGPLLGTLAAFLLVSAWALPRVLSQAFGVSPWKLWASALAPLGLGLPYAFLVWTIAHRHSPSGWGPLFLEMAASGTGGICVWLAGLNPTTRRQWLNRVRSLA